MDREIIEITNLGDPRIEVYTQLKDVNLRKKLEPERGIFLAESFNVIERALRAKYQAISCLATPKLLPRILKILDDFTEVSIPVYVAEEHLQEQITGFHLHRGAIMAMRRPVLPSPEEILSSSRRVVILENLIDHKNVGAAIRSAAALNYDGVLITPDCADPLYRRSIRVSMGTVFQLPWTQVPTWPCIDLLHKYGYLVAALALSADAVTLPQLSNWLNNPTLALNQAPTHLQDFFNTDSPKLALIMGSEGPGLPQNTLKAADLNVIIPMGHGVDSLNVAAATAVACYATSFQN